MKKLNILLVLFLLGVSLFTSCEKDADDDKYSGDPIIAFESASGAISESANGTLAIPVFMAKTSEVGGTVNFIFDIEGIANPAIEGEDFTLVNTSKTLSFAAGEYYAYIEIMPINNDLYEGNKSVNVVLTSGSAGAIIGYDNGGSNVEYAFSIIDDEHPLATWIGSYSVAAASQGNPGSWDEAWTVTTSPDEADASILIMKGIAGSTLELITEIDLDAMTITIEAGQVMEDYNYGNYGPIGIFSGTYAGGVVSGQALTGTVSNDGTIIIDNWVHQFVSGPNAPDI